MKKIASLLTLLLFTVLGRTQSLDGTYVALELISLRIDTSGTVSFYMKDSFPKEVWFHEVQVVIKGSKITVDKIPVTFDSLGGKGYSGSDGGFWTYKGTLLKLGDCFAAKTRLVAFDYVGFSLFEPPLLFQDEEAASGDRSPSPVDTTTETVRKPSVRELREIHDVVKGVHGLETFLPKGTARQDYIIRPGKGGIWINNKFHGQMTSK